MSSRARLRELLAAEETFWAPGVYDGVSARLVEQHRYPAAYMSGACVAATATGLPDLGLTTMTEMAGQLARLTAATDLPVIADADTGFGGPLHVRRTVRAYERAGAAALHLEDQAFPKRCGHLAGKQVVPAEEFALTITAAVEARTDPDLVIIGRTDARGPLGFDEAIARANRYAAAGADVIFVEAPRTIEEIQAVPALVEAPVMFNFVPLGMSAAVTPDQLAQWGYAFVIAPLALLGPAIGAMSQALTDLRTPNGPAAQLSPREVFGTVGIEDWERLADRYESGGASLPAAEPAGAPLPAQQR